MVMEIVLLNPSKDAAERLVGRTIVSTLWDPPRVVMDDGMILLVKAVERDDDGRPVRFTAEMQPRDPSAN